MSAIKEFYHEEICKEMQETESNNDRQYWEYLEDQQIIKEGDERMHSEMPNFLR